MLTFNTINKYKKLHIAIFYVIRQCQDVISVRGSLRRNFFVWETLKRTSLNL